MRAFVLKEPGVVGYVDVPEPRLTPYGAILRPVAVAPCFFRCAYRIWRRIQKSPEPGFGT